MDARRRTMAASILIGAFGAACSPPRADGPIAREPATSTIVFRAQELPFTYDRGESGVKWPVEVTGGGVGLLDYDGDGDLDLFFAQGVPLPVGKVAAGAAPADVLLRNDGGRFVDVSAVVGLSSRGYGQGLTVADYDGDGDPDVYVTRYGPNTLWRNDGGRFVDDTDRARVGCPLWSLGAAFFDYDGDGDLDLYVANYSGFDPAAAPFDRDPATGAPAYGMPARLAGQPDVLYRNDGDGTFTDVSRLAGIVDDRRGMGVVAADMDGDGRVDLFVANDVQENILWHNRGDGTFEDVAGTLGLAANARGQAEANMGIARGDVDGDGLPDLVVSHFVDEHATLWRPQAVPGRGWAYQDRTPDAGIAPDSRPCTGWGAALADFDQDGRPDLVIVNGQVRPEPGRRFPDDAPPLLWRNVGGRFRPVGATAGPYFRALHQARGLAVGDLDGDGDLDLVVVHHHEPSVVLWNQTEPKGHWLRLRLVGRGRNRDAIGARVVAQAGGRTLVRTIDGGGSYLSSSDPAVHLGLGPATVVDRVEVRWPSGRVEARSGLGADRTIDWAEGPGP